MTCEVGSAENVDAKLGPCALSRQLPTTTLMTLMMMLMMIPDSYKARRATYNSGHDLGERSTPVRVIVKQQQQEAPALLI